MHKETKRSTSKLLQALINGNMPESISLNRLKDILHERGFGLLMLIFSLPIAIPLPYPPGFTTIVGTPLMLFSAQMIFGFDSPWLPKRIGKLHIKQQTLAAVITKATPYLEKVECFLKPRLFFFSTVAGERLIGIISFLCSISIALPIVFGNAVPALGILLMSIGLLNRDGIIIVLGMITSFIGLIIASAIVMFGIDGIKSVIGFIG